MIKLFGAIDRATHFRRLTVVVLLFGFVSEVDAADRPNIVFVMADDLGWADVGYNGAEFYETPHIDQLARTGMRFHHGYPGASNCMPSRACIMTGMYTPRTQMWTPGGKAKGNPSFMKLKVPMKNRRDGDTAFPSKLALDSSVESIAERLRNAGYQTGHFGKWHLGPDGQGFHVNDTNGRGAGLDRKFYGNVDVAEDLTTAAIEFMTEKRDDPFFVYLCHWDVHSPIRARKSVVAKYREKLASRQWSKAWNPTYAAMIEAVDQSVGRIHEALQELGVSEKTLFVFTSDNGGSSGATFCEPLKGAKGAFYEGGIRVPLCMSWPGVITPGSECRTPVTGVDYFPTFVALAGGSLSSSQPVDGRSFVPLLSGETMPERSIYWHYPLYLQGAKYARVLPVHGTDRPYWRATPCSVIRRGEWKLMQFFESNSVELYDLKNDISESNDIAEQHPERVRRLLEELKAWQRETDAVIPTELNPLFDPQASR